LPRGGRLAVAEVLSVLSPVKVAGGSDPRAAIGSVTVDSRDVSEGSVFFALPGERVDGADFVAAAFAKGAVAAVVSPEGAARAPRIVPEGATLLVVDDPLRALGDLARAHRALHRDVPLVAITGSAGKTSTKEMVAALLSRSRSVLRNRGNRNNRVGMPLALLELSDGHEAAVLEMGTSLPGEIARLAEIASPDVGVVTNVAPAHLEGLGSMEGVAREKGDLFRALPPGGTAVVNATDLRVVREAGRCRARKVYYGVALNDFSGRILSMDDAGMEIAVRTPTGEFRTAVPVAGEHQLLNAVAAAAAATVLGLSAGDMEGGLASLAPVAGRSRAVALPGGGLLLDDSYNSNPASAEAALHSLAALAKGRRTVAVLGDMLELGDASVASHHRLGRLAARLGVDLLLACGPLSAHTARGAEEGGMGRGAVLRFEDRESLLSSLPSTLREGDAILVKASRGMGLDEAVALIERGEG
jgi:UDP-N-acetylmuramoyl-tripeptide--D-alanyl-D-alanine ligase